MVAPAFSHDSYVDHVLSANLDSTHAFEGPEKLLEIWFWPDATKIPASASPKGLRLIPLNTWAEILDQVSCKILSRKSSAAVDAYLLLELSLFVFPHKMILKTCGTTTTLKCLDLLFQSAQEFVSSCISPSLVHKVFYSRRLFMFPDKQLHVHRDWKLEVLWLNRHFEDGKSYVVGDFTLDDHWYLYTVGKAACSAKDHTLEILMTQLDPECARQFVGHRNAGAESLGDDADLGHDCGEETMKSSKLDSLFVGDKLAHDEITHMPSPQVSDLSDAEDVDEAGDLEFLHDAFSFTPCGFSSNSISYGKGGYYYTLHITPESGWSYASFETNFPFSAKLTVSATDVLKRVLNIFRPGRFSVTMVMESCGDSIAEVAGSASFAQLASSDKQLKKLGYSRHERAIYDLRGEHSLLYMNFQKETL